MIQARLNCNTLNIIITRYHKNHTDKPKLYYFDLLWIVRSPSSRLFCGSQVRRLRLDAVGLVNNTSATLCIV